MVISFEDVCFHITTDIIILEIYSVVSLSLFCNKYNYIFFLENRHRFNSNSHNYT